MGAGRSLVDWQVAALAYAYKPSVRRQPGGMGLPTYTVRTILPMCSELSIRRWASAAPLSGNVLSMTGVS